MKDAQAVKDKMKKKLKKTKKKSVKRMVRCTVFTLLIAVGTCAAALYNRLYFKGEVKEKYQSDLPAENKRNRIVVKTWFGEKDFDVDGDTYDSVEIGENYDFQKDTSVDWIKRNRKDKS